MFLFPASALADLRRGDRGEEVRELQQMLWDTGFIFEEPDGVFGGNTEKAVKWFQEYALLKQTGVVDDRTIDSLYACWLQIMEENGYDRARRRNGAPDRGLRAGVQSVWRRRLQRQLR